MSILVTGGAGYIGSHTVLELLGEGFDVVVLDNLCNSKKESLRRVEEISGKTIKFYKANILDIKALKKIFKKEKISAVIHIAGLKAVGESVEKPLLYYRNNIEGTLNLLEVMKEFNVKNIVFSSSATVYGAPRTVPIKENFHLSASNPYGRTKLFIEQILADAHEADNFNVIMLRYFNPIGAHPSGLIGEDPNGIPNNLMPYISQVAIGKLKSLKIFGNNYSTPDGTGVRDYIHICDLASGHISALKLLHKNPGFKIFNLGTGKGYSVLEIVKAFSRASGKKIPFEITERRKGDIAKCYADPGLAEKELGWKAKRGLEEMCRDAWNWQKKNPNGY